jgi:DNA-binding CsgD family transcriptional regulator
VANTAHTAVLFWLLGGPEHARAVLVRRAGAELDPALARRAERLVRGEAHEYLARQNEALLRLSNARPLGATLGDVAAAFGDFADLQVPEKRGHSRAVARLAHEAARRLGMDEAERETLRLAALVHDIGEVAVPTRVWCVSRAFRPSEAERARTHVYFTERVLASAEPLAAIAPIAAAHHERLDGGGYHRALRASALSMPARVLAAADVFAALREPRPHRPALAFASAVDRIAEMAEGGALDRTAVDAVVGGSASTERPGAPLSHARKTSANAREPDGRAGVTALSARELEVLREVARGRTNKEVAARLGISPRTVQQHTLNIYEKLGVSTRAAAALIAAQCGLLAEG